MNPNFDGLDLIAVLVIVGLIWWAARPGSDKS